MVSFTGEKQAIANYKKEIASAYKSGVLEGVASGAGMGVFTLVIFASYGLAIWYGSRLILEKNYTGGTVLIVLFSVVFGSM